jgi:hypothetical protein
MSAFDEKTNWLPVPGRLDQHLIRTKDVILKSISRRVAPGTGIARGVQHARVRIDTKQNR